MTGAQLLAMIRTKTNTDSTTYTSSAVLIDVNIFKDDIAGQIQQVRPEVFNVPTVDDLVYNQREYAFPDDVMNNLVEVQLRFTTASAYTVAIPLSSSHKYKEGYTESEIVKYHNNTDPQYFIRRKAIYILSGSIATAIGGILMIYNSFPADLANLVGTTDLSIDPSTTTHGFPREFHELLARRVSIEYKDRNNIKLSTREQNPVNLGVEVLASLPSASSRGDDGFEY